jgi:hypothetical protein
MNPPFQVEMLTVYLIRLFVRDLVEHSAHRIGGNAAVGLDPAIARRLGIGNSTGLGMAPFIVNHPVLFNNWIIVREEAIARVRSIDKATLREIATFLDILGRSEILITDWHSEHPIQVTKLADLHGDLEALKAHLAKQDLSIDYPWDHLAHWAEHALSEEGQEFLASLLLEPYGHLVDGLSDCMADSNTNAFRIDGSMQINDVRKLIKENFAWALEIDWDAKQNSARAWYVSEEKLEPRMGERFEEPIADYEQPLAPARDTAAAYEALVRWDGDVRVAEFLLRHPEHRHSVRRIQLGQIAPYGEIRDNTISDDVLPIDMLRAKLSFFGATHFDPRSDRWVRISMYAGAPYPDELTAANCDLWVYPGGRE